MLAFSFLIKCPVMVEFHFSVTCGCKKCLESSVCSFTYVESQMPRTTLYASATQPPDTAANCNVQAIRNLFQIPLQRKDLNLRKISALLWSSNLFGEHLDESGSNYDELNDSFILVSITSVPS